MHFNYSRAVCQSRFVKDHLYSLLLKYAHFSRDTLGCSCLSMTRESPTSTLFHPRARAIFIHKNNSKHLKNLIERENSNLHIIAVRKLMKIISKNNYKENPSHLIKIFLKKRNNSFSNFQFKNRQNNNI